MENSEKHRKAVELGRLIIAQIEQEPQQDVLSGWMAGYLSELLQKAENAEGEEKENLHGKCFSTILELWEHLDSLPSGYRVTRDYDDILKTLESISPQSQRHFYGLDPLRNISVVDEKSKSLKEQLGLILFIDQLARNMIGTVLDDLAVDLKTEDGLKAVHLAKELFPSPHTRSLARLISLGDERKHDNSLDEVALLKTEKLIELAQTYRDILKDRIKDSTACGEIDGIERKI